jgi:hypothetical protein
METLIVGFLGGLIGALGPVLVVLIQTRSQERQARARAALEAAVHEQSFLRQLVKDSGRGGYLAPLSLHIFHYQKILELLTQDRLTADELKGSSGSSGHSLTP